jgi:hypothetical protein
VDETTVYWIGGALIVVGVFLALLSTNLRAAAGFGMLAGGCMMVLGILILCWMAFGWFLSRLF